MKLLAISGSLRAGSKNTTILRAIAALAPVTMQIDLWLGLGELPLFNPDLDDLDHGLAPDPVRELRRVLRACEGVILCSPEYAHGVAGAMKNALDWVVGSGELVGKPVLVINLSSRSTHAHAALLETLRTMDARVGDVTLLHPIAAHAIRDGAVVDPGLLAALAPLVADGMSQLRAARDHGGSAE
jgi:chromate reductase, NAD(P)H dehydrogenase (quinone)